MKAQIKISKIVIVAIAILSSPAWAKTYSAMCKCTIGGSSAGTGSSAGDALKDAMSMCRDQINKFQWHAGHTNCIGLGEIVDIISFRKVLDCARKTTEKSRGNPYECEIVNIDRD